MKRLLVLLMLLICWMLPARGETQEPALTLMVYLCGSDLESASGAATADLEEMIAHYPGDGSVRVLVLASGAQTWHNGVSAEETAIYELTGDGLTRVHALPLQSMGNPATLQALLDYGYAQAPAQRHALILWNHGAGPLLGVCFDEQFTGEGGMDGLSLTELTQALAASPAAQEQLKWIGFDACLMASVETACAVAPYAEYMIASQDTEPATGWSYAFLTEAGRDATGADTGRRIIQEYFASLGNTMAPATLSCVDLSVMQALGAEMDELFDGLHLGLDDGSYPEFAACRVNTKSVGCSTAYEYDLVDLVDLLEVYQAEGMGECGNLLELLDQAIVQSRSNMEYINGLTIHYPHYGSESQTPADVSEGYSAFMADMSAIRLGKPLTDWSSRQQLSAQRMQDATIVTLPLTEEQAAHLDSVSLYIFKEMKGNDYQLIYQTDDVTLTEDNVLMATYENQALFLVNAQGDVISQSIPYSLTEDGVVLSCMLWKEDILSENSIILARAIFRQDEAGVYHLAELLEVTDDPALQGKVTVNLADYCWLTVASNSHCPAYDENGNLLPTRAWTKGDYTYGWEITLAEEPGWSIAFHSLQDNDNRAALLQLTDTQNNLICSELLPIENPNVTAQAVERQLLLENEYCRIWFTGVEVITGNYPQLRMTMECENLHTEAISIGVRNLQFDQLALCGGTGGSSSIDPGTAKSFRLDFHQEMLELMRVTQFRQVEMELRVLVNYFDELSVDHVTLPMALDFAHIMPEMPERTLCSSARLGELEMTLYDLRVEDRMITGVMALHNTGTETIVTDESYETYINDVRVSGNALDMLGDITLPAGTVMYIPVELDLAADALMTDRPYLHGTILEELGETEVHQLGLIFEGESFFDEVRVDFPLAMPLTLPVVSNDRSDSWHTLYDQGGVQIQLMEILWEDDSDNRSLTLCCRNDTDGPVMFYVPLILSTVYTGEVYCSVNGVELAYLSTPADIPPHSVSYQTVSYLADENTRDIREMMLVFTMQDDLGRKDKVRSEITVLGEPIRVDSFHLLEAEQLQVNAAILE